MPLAPSDSIVERLRCELSARSEVLESYVFGSLARGEEQGHSDIDVAVYLEPGTGPSSPFGYAAELAADLMRLLGTPGIDVVELNHAPPLLYGRVLRDGLRLTSRNLGATTRREGRALSRYCDFVPQLAKIEAAHRGRVARGAFGR